MKADYTTPASRERECAKRAERAHLRRQLLALAERREQLQAEQAKVRTEFSRLISEGRAAGWGVTNLARFSGMTRRAIYDLLDLDPAHKESPRDAATSGGTTTSEVADAVPAD
jgi:hypothetical protein